MIESPQFSDEERVAQLVRSTLHVGTQPDNLRLKQLRPALPSQRRRRFGHWQPLAATACAVCFLALGLFGLYYTNPQPAWQPALPTAVAITATFTSEPTATLEERTLTSTAVAGEITAAATRAPLPTPVAALPTFMMPAPFTD